MELIKPSVKFLWMTENPLQAIELAGRTCYKSEDRITADSAEKFVRMLLDRGHHAMVEHACASYRFVCDRGVTHEIVRHRLFSYAQESTRFCNYKGGCAFIILPWVHFGPGTYTWDEPCGSICYSEAKLVINSGADEVWLREMLSAEDAYVTLLDDGWVAQQARAVLPNSLKTEIVVTGNLRQWRHFFKLRCGKAAHPQMREVARMVLDDICVRIPVVFDDVDSVAND